MRQAHVSLAICGILGVGLHSCASTKRRAASSELEEFRAPPVEETKAGSSIKLPNLFAKVGRDIGTTSSVEILDKKDPSTSSLLSVTFTDMSQTECEAARELYSWPSQQSPANCQDGSTSRTLAEFLPPSYQANLGFVFDVEESYSERAPLPEENKRFGTEGGTVTIAEALGTNCWSTAYEALRREPSSFTVHNFSPDEVESYFRQNGTSVTRGEKPTEEFLKWMSGGDIRFGDLLVVKGVLDTDKNNDLGDKAPLTMLHAAIFVDKGVMYERVGNDFPAHLTELKNITDIYKSSRKARFEVLRFSSKFPHVSKTPFKTDADPTMSEGNINQTTIGVQDYRIQKSGGKYVLIRN